MFMISVLDVFGSSDYFILEKCMLSSLCMVVIDIFIFSWNVVVNMVVYEVIIVYDVDFTNVYKVYDIVYMTLMFCESFVDNQVG